MEADRMLGKILYNNKYWLLSLLTDDNMLYIEQVKIEVSVNEIEKLHQLLLGIVNSNYPYFSLRIESGEGNILPSFFVIEKFQTESVEIISSYEAFKKENLNKSFHFSFHKEGEKVFVLLLFHKMFFNIYKINKIISQIKLGNKNTADFVINSDNANDSYSINKFNHWEKIFSNKVQSTNLETISIRNNKKNEISYKVNTKIEKIVNFNGSYQFYLGVLISLICKYESKKEVLIGLQIPDKTLTSNSDGFFFPLHFKIDQQFSFDYNQKYLSEEIEKAYENYVPFDVLLQTYKHRENEINNHPVFQTVFTFIESENMEELFNKRTTSEFYLHFILVKTKQDYCMFIQYNSSKFDDLSIDYFIKNYMNLLEQVKANSKLLIEEYSYVSAVEKEKILSLSIGSEKTEFLGKCIHVVFEEMVDKYPKNIAIVSNRKKINYEELNERSNQLARYLIENNNVKVGSIIGICLERSFEAIIAMLGILKAGCTYIPIDPNLPMDRIIYIMEDSDLDSLITNERFGLAMPVFWSNSICLDLIEKELSLLEKRNLDIKVDPQDLCYIIYTSGSTGQPKGAKLHHEGVTNRILWGIENQLSENNVILQKTTLSFDVSVWEIYGVLLSGGKLVLLDSDRENDITYIREQIVKHNISHLDFVPSQLKIFLEQKKLENIQSLNRITSAGETLSVSLKNDILNKLSCKLYNLYGPTETSLAVTYWECENVHDLETVPIGVPMENTEVYVLDESRKLLPFDVVGEIYIGGKCVGKGYHKKDEITKEKFVPNTISPSISSTLYRTGDLAKLNKKGYIEFLGRNDQQVKIRGYRIELEEIENVLESISYISNAVVAVVGDDLNKRIISYLKIDNTKIRIEKNTTLINNVRDFLAKKLPSYMLPSDYMIIDHLFLTHNGKKDKLNLPEFKSYKEESTFIHKIPLQSTTTHKLMLLYKEVLNIKESDSINIEESFYDIGGNSLLMVSLLERIQQEYGLNIKFMEIIDKLSIVKLSNYIDELIVNS